MSARGEAARDREWRLRYWRGLEFADEHPSWTTMELSDYANMIYGHRDDAFLSGCADARLAANKRRKRR